MQPKFLRAIAILFATSFLLTACQKPPDTHAQQNSAELYFPVPLPEPPPVPEPPPEPSPVPSDIWDVSGTDVSTIDKSRKLIALTFDDAPNKTLERILAVFAEYNENNPDCPAYGTVFCNGIFFNNHTAHTLSMAHAMGFELGNHGYSHTDLTLLGGKTLQDEIDKTDEMLFLIDGKRTHLFRAPYGRVNQAVKAAVSTPMIDWTIDTLDWTGKPENDVYQTVFSQKFSGAIALMHDGYEGTVDALKRLLPDLKAAGYQAVTVSQMAKVHGCMLRRGSVYIRARKQ